MDEDGDVVVSKKFNISCCRSYLTSRGRCYSCPEQELDEEEEHD